MVKSPAVSAPTVLIAASPSEGESMRRAIEGGGYRALVTSGFEAAVALAESESPAVAVVASSLLASGAWQLLARLRGARGRVPTILIDGGERPEGDREGGADAVLPGPIDAAQLVETVALLGGAVDHVVSSPPVGPALGEKDRGWLYQGSGKADILRVDDAIDEFAYTIPSLLSDGARLDRFDREASVPGLDSELGLGPARALEEGRVTLVEADPPAPLSPSPSPSPSPSLVESGDLATTGLPELLGRLCRASYTGRLVLRRGDVEKTILFQSGRAASASSNLPHDQVAELLLRERRIARAEHPRWRALLEEGGEQALVRAGLLREGELAAASQRRAEEILYSCFTWERGSYEASRGPLRAGDVHLHAHPYALALEGIRRHYLPDRLYELVGPPSTELAPRPGLAELAELAGLDEGERRAALQLAHGPLTVAELAAAGALPDGHAYALAFGLLSLGGATRGAGLSSARILGKWAQVCDGDYFALLDLPRDADGDAVEEAWMLLRDEFARARCPEPLLEELGARLDEIALVLDEARRVLAERAIREAYRAHLAPL